MDDLGKILIADDELTFLHATADLLRKEGYFCDCAENSGVARELIKKNRYDLLIADIKMPGNDELEFIHELPSTAKGLPVILVTAFPSVQTAIKSIHLPVIAYLIKPIDFDDLIIHIKSSLRGSQVQYAMNRSRNRLMRWFEELDGMMKYWESEDPNKTDLPLDAFLKLTLQNVVNSVSDIRGLTEVLADDTGERYICRILKCPRGEELVEGIREAVKVLERSKSAFKSKALADLKENLLRLLEAEIEYES